MAGSLEDSNGLQNTPLVSGLVVIISSKWREIRIPNLGLFIYGAGFVWVFFLNYFIYHYGCLLSRTLALSSFLFAFCSPGHFAFSDWSWLLDDSLILAGQRNLLMTQIFCKWSPCGFSSAKYVLKECTLPSDFCNSLKAELYLRKRNHGLQAQDLMLIPSALWKRPWRLPDACHGLSGQMEQYR